jgi:hypothetical protein
VLFPEKKVDAVGGSGRNAPSGVNIKQGMAGLAQLQQRPLGQGRGRGPAGYGKTAGGRHQVEVGQGLLVGLQGFQVFPAPVRSARAGSVPSSRFLLAQQGLEAVVPSRTKAGSTNRVLAAGRFVVGQSP